MNTANGASLLEWLYGPRGAQLLEDLPAHPELVVHVWWQGEADGDLPPDVYQAGLIQILQYVARPVLIVQVADTPRMQPIRAVQQALAAHPLVALIPTDDLPHEPDGVHCTAECYGAVVQRLLACYQAQCWGWQ